MKNIKAVIVDGEVCIVHGRFLTKINATSREVTVETVDQDNCEDVAEMTLVLPGPLLLEKLS